MQVYDMPASVLPDTATDRKNKAVPRAMPGTANIVASTARNGYGMPPKSRGYGKRRIWI